MTAAAAVVRGARAVSWWEALVPVLFAAVALRHSLGGPLPPGDGGLFYLIGRELAAHFPRLPDRVEFSGMDLPVGYPPLGFYVAAVLSRAGVPLDEAMRWIPLACMTAAVAIACLLLRRMASSPAAAALAALLLVGMPRFWAGQVAGGGITRAPGLVFCLLSWLLAASARGRWRYMAAAGAGVGLATLFHPEMGIYAGAGVLFLALQRAAPGQRRETLAQVAAAAGVAAVVSSPWWGYVVWREGPGLLLEAARGSQGDVSLRGLVPLLPPVYGEAQPWPVALLALTGTVACACARRPWPLLMAAWLVLVDPRKGTVLAAVPLALGGGEALALLVGRRQPWAAAAAGVVAALALWSGLTARASPMWPLEKVDADALAAASVLREVEGEVLVLSGVNWIQDPWSDWGPALTGKPFLLTVQGSEWLGPSEFAMRRERYRAVQECVRERDTACLTDYMARLRPAVVWVVDSCRCPEIEAWLAEQGAAARGPGVFALEHMARRAFQYVR